MAIAFDNNYLDLPQHFLQYQQSVFNLQSILLERIQMENQLYKMMNGEKNDEQAEKMGEKQDSIDKIKIQIANKDY